MYKVDIHTSSGGEVVTQTIYRKEAALIEELIKDYPTFATLNGYDSLLQTREVTVLFRVDRLIALEITKVET